MISPALQLHIDAQTTNREIELIPPSIRKSRFLAQLERDAAEFQAKRVNKHLALRSLLSIVGVAGESIVPDGDGLALKLWDGSSHV